MRCFITNKHIIKLEDILTVIEYVALLRINGLSNTRYAAQLEMLHRVR